MIKKLEQLDVVPFIFVVAFAALLIKIPIALVTDVLNAVFTGTDIFAIGNEQDPVFTLSDTLIAVVFAPITETVIGQFLPIVVLSKLTTNSRLLIILSAGIFALLHLPVVWFLPSAFAIGVILSWAYLVQKKLGHVYAFIVVAIIHALHNGLAFLIAFGFSGSQ